MKFIHFSDTHLGFSELSKADPETGVNQREQDFYQAWWCAIDKIISIKPDFVIHAGDLFQTPRPNNRAIAIAFEGIKKLGDADIPFVVVAGNHSTPRIHQTGSIFESLNLFEHVFAAWQGKYETFQIGDCAIHCIPHCSFTEELEKACNQITKVDGARFQVLTTHGAWREPNRDSIGKIGEFNEQFIENPESEMDWEFDYIALGHYHKNLQVGPHSWYSGSLERTSFNELGYTSGFMLVDLLKQTNEYISIPSRPMVAIEPIECEGLTPDDVYKKIAENDAVLPAGAMVKVVLKGLSREMMLALEMSRIDACIPSAFYVEKMLIPIETVELRHIGSSIGALDDEFRNFMGALDESDAPARKAVIELGLSLLHEVENHDS